MGEVHTMTQYFDKNEIYKEIENVEKEVSLACDALKKFSFSEYKDYMKKAEEMIQNIEKKESAFLAEDIAAGCYMTMAGRAMEYAEEKAALYHRIYELEVMVKENNDKSLRSSLRLMLVCANGISTSMLISRIKEHMNPEDVVEAASIYQAGNKIDKFDVVLLGPHMKPQAPLIENICRLKHKPCALIDSVSYGRLDGKAVFEQAKNLL